MNPFAAAAYWTAGLAMAVTSIGVYVWAVDFTPRAESRGLRIGSLALMALALCSFRYGAAGRIF